MLKPKKRVTKQDLKEDKFVKTTLQVKTYIDENYRQVVTVVLAIFAVIVILIVYGQLKSQTSAEAQAELGIAQIEYTNNNLDNASERLVRLIEDYGSTDEAMQGMLILANIYFQQNDYEQAEIYFREFVDSYSGSEVLLSSGYAGLAACMEIKNDFASASEYYETAADASDNYIEKDDFLYLSGICAVKAGNKDKAIEIFQRIVDDSEASQKVREAEVQLVLLGESTQK
jgi:outer membrane protein assembly factor BamD (BamD/ComL family)